MSLPVILKVMSDTSGVKLGPTITGMDNLKVSSQKASIAVKQLVSGLASGQDPISTLTSVISGLTRNFGIIGVGAAAVAGGIAIFAKESNQAKEASEKLNTAIEGFQDNALTLDLGGAITQFKNLSNTIKSVGEEMSKPGALDQLAQGVVGFFGGNKAELQSKQELAKVSKKQAEFAIQTQLAEEANMMSVARTNKQEGERLKLTQKFTKERNEFVKMGVSEQTLSLLKKKQDEEFLDIAKKQGDEEAEQNKKRQEEAKKIEELKLATIEKEAKEKEKAFLEEMRQANTLKKKREDLIEAGRSAQGTILDKLRGAAERFGLTRTVSQIDEERRKQQQTTDTALLGRAGIDPTRRQGFGSNEMISQFAATEGEMQREADNRLFESVDTMKKIVNGILSVVIDKLGVPILRSAN